MKVLVADKLDPGAIEDLRSLGLEIESKPDLKDDTLLDELKSFDPQILIVRSTKVPGTFLDEARSLELVVRAGAGYDNIDWRHASESGIFVSNCPGKNA